MHSFLVCDQAQYASLQANQSRMKHRDAKLNAAIVANIKAMAKDNPKLNQSELGRKLGVHSSQISRILSGQNWKHA